MSTEVERLEAQLKAAFEGPAWHGPSVLEALQGVAPELAAAHPVVGAHSIWELVLHLGGTYRLVLGRLEGKTTPFTPAEDWPSVPETTAAHWRDAVGALHELNRRIRDAVLRFDEGRLDQPLVPEPPYPAYTQFIGITQHDLYHAGQIAILKKARSG
jgi:uncharacterized damage-inducible protein DinB